MAGTAALSLGPSEWASSLMSLSGPPENTSHVPVTLESGKNQRSLGSFPGKCRPDHRGREDGVVSLFLPPPPQEMGVILPNTQNSLTLNRAQLGVIPGTTPASYPIRDTLLLQRWVV